jgi:CRISPR-associated endoribonuclease Cas6
MSEPQAHSIPAIPYVRLQMTLQAEEPATLPPFQGSMLRGAFGHALRRTVCVMGPEQECASCLLRHACVYTRIFEPYVEGEPPPFLRGIDQAVRPYVFEPLGGIDHGEERLAPGDPLRFDLLLFGQAVDLQAYAFLAVERMARVGLGAGRPRFRLVQVEALGTPEMPEATRELFSAGSPPATDPAPPVVPAEAVLPSGRLALRLETPLRVKVRDQLNGHPTFRDLAFNMLRRVLELAHFHVAGASIDWSFRELLDRAGAVRVVAADLRWHDWERWSNRQQSSMKLGGLVGRLVLEGDLTPFAALLGAAQIVHVGKGATFGLGKLAVEPA